MLLLTALLGARAALAGTTAACKDKVVFGCGKGGEGQEWHKESGCTDEHVERVAW